MFGLTVEEYAIVADEVMAPYRFEFLDHVPQEIPARREEWRGHDAVRRVDALNEALAPFDYRLEAKESIQWQRTLFDLYQGDELLLPGLGHVWPVAVNESGTDFALAVENAPNTTPLYLLVHNGGLETIDWNLFVHAAPPVYLGDDLLTIEITDAGHFPIKRNGETFYTYAPKRAYAGSPPVVRLVTWEGHWILETFDGTFMDGESLEEQLGVDQVFHYIIFQGQPLYFYTQAGKVHISYGGESPLLIYEEVVHHQCCEPAVFNVDSNEHMLWFYGLREGTWHYVEIGVYGE